MKLLLTDMGKIVRGAIWKREDRQFYFELDDCKSLVTYPSADVEESVEYMRLMFMSEI